MTLALVPAMKAGRRWAIGVAAATALLMWLHLRILLPLPGTGGTVPAFLGMWSIYLLSLGAAALALAAKPAATLHVKTPVEVVS
jgi:hypothetical protein